VDLRDRNGPLARAPKLCSTELARRRSVQAFNGWVMLDRHTDAVWMLEPNYHRKGDTPLVMSCWSLPMTGFPNRTVIPRADFDIFVGQGLVAGEEPIETDPVCLISWSDDGGASFGNPLNRTLGRQAKAKTPISVNGREWRALRPSVEDRYLRFDLTPPFSRARSTV